ncbi:anthranilate phosphoribosyltransferase [Xylanimonas sp. McL0601]|uniref:anthranilate phosphoribosyltransferase n=1 Tax=Xylanimonas sp. McL0601 TaxID=3414739 RepID=UPI003CE70E3D
MSQPVVDNAPATDPTLAWPVVLNQLVAGGDLTGAQAAWAMDEVMSGAVSPARLAGFLMGLRAKGETVDELGGLAASMLAHATRIEVPGRTVDLVGTGGDRAHTVNISTMAAIVVAGAGLRVVKHGNRAATSASGAADVLEALGIRLDHAPERVAQIATQAGITFCFATVFHPSMRHAGVARKELAVPTAFNFLGPLTNPAQTSATAVGCADARMAPLMAGVFAERGTSALVFRGDDGLDELAATGGTAVWEVCDGVVTSGHLDAAADLGLTRIEVADLRGADAAHNARVALGVLDGSDRSPVRETVLLNAAAALVADGTLPGTAGGTLVERLAAGIGLAARSVDDGAAMGTLERWRAASA